MGWRDGKVKEEKIEKARRQKDKEFNRMARGKILDPIELTENDPFQEMYEWGAKRDEAIQSQAQKAIKDQIEQMANDSVHVNAKNGIDQIYERLYYDKQRRVEGKEKKKKQNKDKEEDDIQEQIKYLNTKVHKPRPVEEVDQICDKLWRDGKVKEEKIEKARRQKEKEFNRMARGKILD